ncbi:MAG TPA: type I 3-dehydroquinate dehydratase [Gemmataceae bacterium]|nr:type I 3-dehydroquinate dehydratase [Gemmataceae bacterium]
MICISINSESRRLALADMVNAKHFGDILEIRLDRFGKSPDIGELIHAKPRPVLMACRRPEDGGYWDGTEDERLAILRQCIISKADYVEIELDVADEIRPFPGCKRVISYTNLRETPADIVDIYEEMRSKYPDVIKLVTLARTPEEAWPLVQILAKSTVPTVVVGLGKPGIMLSILSKKLGAPWVYAALERGMEAYPGQPTVSDFQSIYRLQDIERATRLIGVTGFGTIEQITVAALNAVFAELKLGFRCLPLGVGNLKTFRKIMDAAKLAGVVISAEYQSSILEIQPELHGIARQTHAADLIIHKDNAWHALHTSAQAWMDSLKNVLSKRYPPDNPFKDRFVLIAGVTGAANVFASQVQRLGGNAIIASNDKKLGPLIAHAAGCRYVGFEALYNTMHDVLVVCDEEKDAKGKGGIHSGYLRQGMTVMDLTAGARDSKLLHDAKERGCDIVPALDLLVDLLELQANTLTGKHVPRAIVQAAIPERFLEEE